MWRPVCIIMHHAVLTLDLVNHSVIIHQQKVGHDPIP